MEIFIQKTGERLSMQFEGSAKNLLKRLDINPEVVLIVKDGTLITESDPVDDAKRIELLSVISGG
jgi:sulfur carrier protein ThiS